MEVCPKLYPDILRQIFYFCSHRDLINWRLVSKEFKNIIDTLQFPYDFYTACEYSYYVVIQQQKNLIHNWKKAFMCACRNSDTRIMSVFKDKNVGDVNDGLIEACRVGNINVIKYFIENKLHLINSYGNFYISCYYNFLITPHYIYKLESNNKITDLITNKYIN
ncbi:MAG: F-box protein [Candidatus Micrarchaeaceae archaeon]